MTGLGLGRDHVAFHLCQKPRPRAIQLLEVAERTLVRARPFEVENGGSEVHNLLRLTGDLVKIKMPRLATKSNPALTKATAARGARARFPVWLLAVLLVLVTIALYWPATG